MLHAFLEDEASSIRAETESGRAEQAITEFDPDLVLLDLRMPEPDGMELLRRIREVRESAGFLPVIILTGDDSLSLIHISEPTRLGMISYAVFCLKKKKQ